jgi:hypothetical protein
MSRFMYLQCRSSRIPFPRWATRWVNVRKIYSNSYKCSRVNILTMLEYLGLSFEGRQHCGLDDARNIARILTYMINDGCNIYVNERMFDSKLASLSCQYDAEVSCVARGDDDDADAVAVAACAEDGELSVDVTSAAEADDDSENYAETARVETTDVEAANGEETSGTTAGKERNEKLHGNRLTNGLEICASSCRSDDGICQVTGELNRLSVQHL